ncbi:DEAD/DEAH box helicase family protein [Pasteurella atlantica]|uniref:DEAD/DEAH box helicase family protein n=2 Tax=Pasteurellaceae TaxID=712 RepID=A0ACC6HKE6_9PAST|nr:DEAD/DEAH box helicase family protein [Pasteurella atlantica]MDP8051340.1 DEAD/DEAH box helicase family protein [Pasteurella atlantica]MDP8104780.1 DEAD/DEAH box helicase family protein [Pasteurella atlantica]MDP8147998.1 DEAD/DEAH box helicase family protein [Pasteurella atlantica]
MLFEKIEGAKEFTGSPEIPSFITDNLKFNLFDWQKNALENLIIFENKPQEQATHLMFNMATGTGKTLLMASCILHYYKKGYRHFLFFVNQNNIVDKTENNFIDVNHNKYLFKQKIIIDNKTVVIKKVESFSDNPQGIEIKFTTVQKFYNDIHAEKENINTLDELKKLNLVLLADEAHHLNANTKNKKQEELDLNIELTDRTSDTVKEKLGWEHTILELVLKPNPKNIMLEFTATIPDNEEVQKKYQDKIIAKFDLKQFLQAGFTKEINLLSSTFANKERILTALLFAWYRHQIALKYKIPHFKSVILFRSKTIAESEQDYEYFLQITQNISHYDFDFIHSLKNEQKDENINEMGNSRIVKMLKFIEKEHSFSQIADWIKHHFSQRQTIITNSKSNTTKTEKTDEETEKLLNSLEDKNNPIRAIFTVDRLTEGWDVLNLFDIVRLYQTQNAGGSDKKTPETTVKEMQLIGRGVRYYPFDFDEKLANKRKFDDDLDHDLRILEELYFHTFDEDSRYISHLKAELKKKGFPISNKKVVQFELKPQFKEIAQQNSLKVFANKQIKNANRRKRNLDEVKHDFYFEYQFPVYELKEEEIDFNEEENNENTRFVNEQKIKTDTITFSDLSPQLFYKAMAIKAKSDNSTFQFKSLQQNLQINSVKDLLKDEFLGDIKLHLKFAQPNFDAIPAQDKLDMMLTFISKIFAELDRFIYPNKGTEYFYAKPLTEVFGEPKKKLVEESSATYNVQEKDWYVLNEFVGTSEEEKLLKFMSEHIQRLEQKYENVYLLRNEEVYKIYDFEQGRGFDPDFLLFLKSKTENIYYQIFIEPKGEHLLEKDKWKEDFLLQISQKYAKNHILNVENSDYKLVGLPFFNELNDRKKVFVGKFNELVE